MRKPRLFSVLAAGLAAAITLNSQAAQKDSFSVCWTLYAGWMPWEYGATQGIVDKWAKKYGINIDLVQLNDYVESINQYSAGQFDGCTMTNMDALTIAAAFRDQQRTAQIPLTAPVSGIVHEVRVQPGAAVRTGQRVAIIEQA